MTKITFENLPSTNTPINASNLNELQDNVEIAINTIDAKTRLTSTVLWTNSSPSADFSGTINLSSDDYDFIKIFFNTIGAVEIEKGNTNNVFISMASGSAGNKIVVDYRRVTLSNDNLSISFSNCTEYIQQGSSTSSSTVNTYMIPQKVIGYKEV